MLKDGDITHSDSVDTDTVVTTRGGGFFLVWSSIGL